MRERDIFDWFIATFGETGGYFAFLLFVLFCFFGPLSVALWLVSILYPGTFR